MCMYLHISEVFLKYFHIEVVFTAFAFKFKVNTSDNSSSNRGILQILCKWNGNEWNKLILGKF